MGHYLSEMDPNWDDARQARLAELKTRGYTETKIHISTYLVCLRCGCLVVQAGVHDRVCLDPVAQ